MKNQPIDHVANIQEKLSQLIQNMPCVGYIRQAGLIPHILPISGATLWRYVDEGRMPAPYKLSPGVTAWKVRDIVSWIETTPKIRVHKRKVSD